VNFGRILIKLGPNVDPLSIDPDSVSGKTATVMILMTALVTKTIFVAKIRRQNPRN